MQALPDGKLLWTSFRRNCVWFEHASPYEVYNSLDDANGGLHERFYGACLQFPNLDPSYTNVIVIFGGSVTPTCAGGPCPGAMDSVQMRKGTLLSNPDCWPNGGMWTDFVDSNHGSFPACGNDLKHLIVPRGNINVVILPDASILAIGGASAGGGLFSLERFVNGTWTSMASGASSRDYHSTAAFLPSGKVALAGGEGRSYDFQVFVPPYICPGTLRPLITGINGGNPELSYDQEFIVTFNTPPGTTVDWVVLMRPSSVTHHVDYDQRYVKLEPGGAEGAPGSIYVRTPAYRPGPAPGPYDANRLTCLPGWYMLVVVATGGIPSPSGWVRIS